MGDKRELCVACGRFAPADGPKRRGRMIDTGDGDGLLWTCTDCAPLPGPRYEWPVGPAKLSYMRPGPFPSPPPSVEGDTPPSRWIRRIEIAVYAYLAMLVVAAVAFITWIEGNGAI